MCGVLDARLTMAPGERHPGDGDDDQRDADHDGHPGSMGCGDAVSGDGNGFHETPCGSGTPLYLPTARAGDEAARRVSATGVKNAAGYVLRQLRASKIA